MTLTDQHIRALTFLACDIRPHGARQWQEADVYAEIVKLRDRNLGSVVCAVTRAAMERGCERPAVISSAGSHWGDTMLPAAFVPRIIEPAERCSVCSRSERDCRIQFGGHCVRCDLGMCGHHEFDTAIAAAKRKDEGSTEAAAAAIAALKAERAAAPKREPAPAQGLEALAERDPELKARVEAVRAAMPAPMGLQESEAGSGGVEGVPSSSSESSGVEDAETSVPSGAIRRNTPTSHTTTQLVLCPDRVTHCTAYLTCAEQGCSESEAALAATTEGVSA